jgi:hypothetical protein
MRFVVIKSISSFLVLLLCVLSAGCGGGEDVTTITPEDQKMLDTSHAQAADAMKGAAQASKGLRPGGHN